MKKLFLLVCFAVSLGATAFAQPVVSSKINKGYNPYYSGLDSIIRTGNDTVYASISGTKTSVGFEWLLNMYAGSTDTFSVTLFGNKMGTNAPLAWYKISTYKATGSGAAVLDTNITGNPFTNYMWTFSSSNITTTAAAASIRSYVLIR